MRDVNFDPHPASARTRSPLSVTPSFSPTLRKIQHDRKLPIEQSALQCGPQHHLCESTDSFFNKQHVHCSASEVNFGPHPAIASAHNPRSVTFSLKPVSLEGQCRHTQLRLPTRHYMKHTCTHSSRHHQDHNSTMPVAQPTHNDIHSQSQDIHLTGYCTCLMRKHKQNTLTQAFTLHSTTSVDPHTNTQARKSFTNDTLTP